MGFFLLISSALAGFAVVRRVLGETLRLPEQLFWGIVAGWILSAAGAYLAARALGRLSVAIVFTTSVCALLIALALLVRDFRAVGRLTLRNRWRREHIGLLIVLFVLTPILWKVFSAQMFARDANGIYSGGSSLYDLSFHATVASSFAYGANFPPVYTPLPPEPLLYPPLPDFHAAMLMALGWSFRSAFLWTAFPLAIALVGIFFSFALRLSRSTRAAVIASFLFFFNGGLGFVYLFRDWRASGHSLTSMLWNPPANYGNAASLGLHWVNVIADALAPQRTTLYALPVAIIVLTLFYSTVPSSESAPNTCRSDALQLLFGGVLTGLLCYLQPHIAIAIGVVALGQFLMKPRRAWFAFLISAAIVSMPFLVNALGHATSSGFMRFQPGWLGRDEPHQIVYWLRNLGLPLLLIVPAYLVAPLQLRRFYLPFVFVMLVAVLFVLSPNDYDNLKLMIVWYAATVVLIAMFLARLSQRKWLIPIVAIAVLICIASGVLAVRRGMIEHQIMFSNEQLEAADYIRRNTSPHALFLTAPAFHDPALVLAGRPVVRGVTDWLWSHGYNFREREADVRRIYAGTFDTADLIRYYQVDYVYLGAAEVSDLKADTKFFAGRYREAYHSPSIIIYDTRSGSGGVGAMNTPAPRELASRIDVDPDALLVDFPGTSFFIYRFIKSAYGRMPAREEMMASMKQLGRGVFVGRDGHEEQLNTNRAALINEWMQTPEFKKLYGAKSNADFVDTVLRNQNASSQQLRDALVRRLDAGESRQTALLAMINDRDFAAREYNSAYVLMHFFGYLGRNPGAAPDHDLSGFNFWKSVLDRTSDYRALSRAFLESSEYKSRAIR